MNVEKFRPIFARFQNLNLLFLIEDLRRGLVARGRWLDIDRNTICPLRHGWRSGINHSCLSPDPRTALDIGLTAIVVKEFRDWWDRVGYCCLAIPCTCQERNWALFWLLESILAERQADADAVQRLTGDLPALESQLAGLEGRMVTV